MQPKRHVGILGGIFGGLLDGHLAEGDLLRALSRDVFVLDRADAEITFRRGVHVVARGTLFHTYDSSMVSKRMPASAMP